jgi:hypothetical protein
MKTQSKMVVILSDLHIGSTVGLWPTGFVSNEGNHIGQNKFQEWLWECWCDAMQWSRKIIGKDAFDLVLNGDLVDGIHHKTLQVMTPDPGDQTSAVLQTLNGLGLQWSKLHVIKGTEAHSRNDEIRIGHALGATGTHKPGSTHGTTSTSTCMGAFTTSPTTSARPPAPTLRHRRIRSCLATLTHARARAGKPVPKVMVRAHRHRHGIWQDGNQISIITGAWQGLTRYGYKVVPDAVPQPSIIIADHRQADKGDLPLLHSRVYTAA